MEYQEILNRLPPAGSSSLENAVDVEAEALFQGGAQYQGRNGKSFAKAAAQEFYAEDITRQLTNPLPITPHRVLAYRRAATVWAIVAAYGEVLR